MPRRRCCSVCHNEGHNSRTCNARDPPENNTGRETISTDNHTGLQLDLTLGRGSCDDRSSSQPLAPASMLLTAGGIENHGEVQINKGVRWSAEEHLSFLRGLQVLGEGAWKVISERYVRTRTANQVSSHAQKYFKRMKHPLRRKRNPSIFDVGREEDPLCSLYSVHATTRPNRTSSSASAKQSTSSSPPVDSCTIRGQNGGNFDGFYHETSSGHGNLRTDETESSRDREAG